MPLFKNTQNEKFSMIVTRGLSVREAYVRTPTQVIEFRYHSAKRRWREEEHKGTKPPLRKNTVERLGIYPILLSRPMSRDTLEKTKSLLIWRQSRALA